MSCYDVEPADVFSIEHRTANRPHTCDECRSTIGAGERYDRVAMCYDGGWTTTKTCLPCVSAWAEYQGIDGDCYWVLGELHSRLWEMFCYEPSIDLGRELVALQRRMGHKRDRDR